MFLFEQLSIGNLDIDNEHRKLLEIINDMVDLLELKKDQVEFARILSNMTDYSLFHFEKEEKYMDGLSYPKISEHRALHKKFIYKVVMYNVKFSQANSPNPEKVIIFMKNWWINHILKIDAQYEIFRKENGLNVEY